MTTKSDYTEEEWNGLIEAPMMGGTYIITADVSVTAMGKEMKGMLKAMQAQDAPAAAADLVAAVVADVMAKTANKEKMGSPEFDKHEDPMPQFLQTITAGVAVLDTKATPEEAAGYKQWLMRIAQATAEAGKEGGILGIGAVRVSDKEKAAIDQLGSALGV